MIAGSIALIGGESDTYMGIQEPERVRWPGHLPVGALRVVRWSANYDQTVLFYRDMRTSTRTSWLNSCWRRPRSKELSWSAQTGC